MKNILLIVPVLFLMSFVNWQSSFTAAVHKAKKENKLILLNFSGSDWCGPCIMMKKEIFESDTFRLFSDTTLYLVNADFPRQKKNLLSAEQQQQNNDLADIYNTSGTFPKTMLLTADGKIIRVWEGKPKENVIEFIEEIKTIIDSRK